MSYQAGLPVMAAELTGLIRVDDHFTHGLAPSHRHQQRVQDPFPIDPGLH
jgi:hypothetical protein